MIHLIKGSVRKQNLALIFTDTFQVGAFVKRFILIASFDKHDFFYFNKPFRVQNYPCGKH